MPDQYAPPPPAELATFAGRIVKFTAGIRPGPASESRAVEAGILAADASGLAARLRWAIRRLDEYPPPAPGEYKPPAWFGKSDRGDLTETQRAALTLLEDVGAVLRLIARGTVPGDAEVKLREVAAAIGVAPAAETTIVPPLEPHEVFVRLNIPGPRNGKDRTPYKLLEAITKRCPWIKLRKRGPMHLWPVDVVVWLESRLPALLTRWGSMKGAIDHLPQVPNE